jgi:hypothetical protein
MDAATSMDAASTDAAPTGAAPMDAASTDAAPTGASPKDEENRCQTPAEQASTDATMIQPHVLSARLLESTASSLFWSVGTMAPKASALDRTGFQWRR